jgi:hypothetical protein
MPTGAVLLVVFAALLFTTVAYADEASPKSAARSDKGEATFRVFTVDEGFLQLSFDKYGDAKQQLRAKGVVFYPGTLAIYLPKMSKLIVYNGSDQIELIGELVNAWNQPVIQVRVGAVFVNTP